MCAGYEFDTSRLRFVYSSMTTPAETYDYDMATRERTLRKRQEVPSGHNPADYVTRRLFAPAPDGEMVPVSLLYKKTTPLDGSAPVFLYGYGAYGIAMPASFSTGRLSLVDRGFIYAIAHIRGGKDKGYRWYTDGKMAKKTNTFTDFIAAGEYLVAEGLTKRGRIVANGGSAGGMLMGVVANMAPDLFSAIIADVPFVDVLNTMLDKDLPLTPPEWPEWGNPLASKERVRDHQKLFALRQRRGQSLSAHSRARRPHRSARHLLGTGKVDRQAARAEHQRQHGASEDQHGRRTRRRLRPLRQPEGHRTQFRIRAEGGGVGIGSAIVLEVILGLVPRIHLSASARRSLKRWILGMKPRMTAVGSHVSCPQKQKGPPDGGPFVSRSSARLRRRVRPSNS